MWPVLKRLLLGIILILIASGILLFSDVKHRQRGAVRNEPVESQQTKKWRILLAMLVEAAPMEEASEGMRAGLNQAGLVEGQDYEIVERNAQGDMATLNSILDTASTDQVDMIFTITTPALQTAMNKVKDKPVIFSLAVDPASWGGAKSESDHPPNMTGVYVNSPFQRMIDVIRQCFPKTKKIGTLFSPAESNSVYIKDLFSSIVRKNGLEIVTVPVNSSVEVSEASQTLVQRGIDAFCQIGDNTSSAAFPSIIRVADAAKVPLFCFSSFHV
ncbi:MAG: ABC transporter substrate-binding protein, partial [Acidobacteriota bacterium]